MPAEVTISVTCHELKAWPEPFEAVWRGSKTVEVRRDDRGFEPGHALLLREWEPCPYCANELEEAPGVACGLCPKVGRYTGRQVLVFVTHKLTGWGLQPGYCALSLSRKRSCAPVGTQIGGVV